MNMQSKIDAGPGYDRLAEAMDAEGIVSIRRCGPGFKVELANGSVATGFTIRGAITNANSQAAA